MKIILKLLSKNTRALRTQTSSISTASSSSIASLSATMEPYALTLLPEFLSSRESSNKDSDKLLSCSDNQQVHEMHKLWRPHQTMVPRPSVYQNNNRHAQSILVRHGSLRFSLHSKAFILKPHLSQAVHLRFFPLLVLGRDRNMLNH